MSEKKISFVILVMFVLFSMQNIIAQCDCASPDICRSFKYADDVVVGIVKEVNTINGYKISKFQIEISYKGILRDEILVSSHLEIGQRYVLYPIKEDENIYDVFGCCSRDKKLEDAFGELNFLESIKNGKSKNQIYGTIRNKSDKTPIKTSIEVIGSDKTYQFYTDENGVYQVSDLPLGTYKFRPNLQTITFENIIRPQNTKEIFLEIKENTCWEVNILTEAK